MTLPSPSPFHGDVNIASVGVGSLTSGTARPSLDQRVMRVHSALDELEKMIGDLRGRLEPVLAPGTPQPPDDGKTRPDADRDGSWLAEQLEAVAQRVGSAIQTVRATTHRIDL